MIIAENSRGTMSSAMPTIAACSRPCCRARKYPIPCCVITVKRARTLLVLDHAVAVAVLEADALEQRACACLIVGIARHVRREPETLPGVIGPQTGTASPRRQSARIASRSTACEIA